jgi:hypothetical protein
LRIHDRLIITLAVVFGLTNLILALLGQNDISIYFIVDAIGYMVVVLAFTDLNPRSKTALSWLGTFFFVGFLAVTVMKVSQMLK